MLPIEHIEFLEGSLRRSGELQISDAVAMELFEQARREISFRHALEIIAGQPVDAAAVARSALNSLPLPALKVKKLKVA